MRTAFLHSTLLLTLCLTACSHRYTPRQFRLVTDGISQRVQGAVVTREFFNSSGVRPYLGRFFVEPEFQPNQFTAAVLSYGIWQRAFHSRPEVIGSKIELDDRPVVVVGVAEPSFDPGGAGEVWLSKS